MVTVWDLFTCEYLRSCRLHLLFNFLLLSYQCPWRKEDALSLLEEGNSHGLMDT